MIKSCLSFIIALCLLATSITPAYSSTLPNAALFNWVEYKYASLFPKHLTTKTELTHEGVHYDLRYWSGAWGTRFLCITDDGEIFGLGDFTDGTLKSFGFIEHWADAIIADEDVVYSLNYNLTVTVSPTPDYPQILDDNQGEHGWDQAMSTTPIKGMDELNRVFHFPSLFIDEPFLPALEFIETAQDTYVLNRAYNDLEIGFARHLDIVDESRADYKRFVFGDQGLERRETLLSREHSDFDNGYVWVATDYGNGFEFQQVENYRSFYHGGAVYDYDNDGFEEIFETNLTAPGTVEDHPQAPDGIHVFDYNETSERYEQIDVFPANDTIKNGGSIEFADLDNDGVKEMIAATQVWNNVDLIDGFEIRKLNANGEYEIVYELEEQGVFVCTVQGENQYAVGIHPVDYNKDGQMDLLFSIERWSGAHAVELFRNNGNFEFEIVTDQVFEQNVNWLDNNGEFSNWELNIADINSDGLDDIVFHGTWGSLVEQGGWYDVGSMIFLNVNGRKFVRQNDNDSLEHQFNGFSETPQFLHHISTENNTTIMWGLRQEDYTPMVFRVEVH